MDLHVEGAGALGHSPADLAHAENSEPLAVEPLADELHGLPAAPFLLLQKPLALGRAPGRAKNKQHGDFGGGDGDGVGRVRHADAARFGGGKVDVIEADGIGGDDAQARGQPADDIGVEFLGERD